MDWDDLLSLLTLGAVLPYLADAAAGWLRGAGRHGGGPDALF